MSPHRFRSKKQFWAYCGLGIVMRSSSDWVKGKDGSWIRAKMATTRGLNRNYNRTLKWVFKGAATRVITGMPKEMLNADYYRRLAQGTKPNLAKLTLARQLAALVLAMWKSEKEYDETKRRGPEKKETDATRKSGQNP